MGKKVGQHYLQAAWIGEHFVYDGEEVKKHSRKTVLKSINVSDIFKEKKIMEENFDSFIIDKKAEKLFSGEDIDKHIEDIYKLGQIEYNKENLENFLFMKEGNLESISVDEIPFLTLHESRNKQVYRYYKKLINIFLAKKNFTSFDMNSFKYINLLNESEKKYIY